MRQSPMQHRRAYSGLALLLTLAACKTTPNPGLGEVYAGPMNLTLRAEIGPKSKAVVTVHHGDRLAIVQQRRRLYRVRTAGGIEGWTDESNLMSVTQMAALQQLEERARRLSSQGVATTFDSLNVHTEPQRFAPSFVQIQKDEKFDIVGHQISPRAEASRRVLVKPPSKPESRDRKKGGRAERKKGPLPPAPAPPKPPADWEELSRSRDAKTAGEHGGDEENSSGEPIPADDWTLIRTQKGTAGWVLTNRIFLAIPDEVAQYAEGHRIVAYFPLGTIHDSELETDKNIWLWTTIHSGQMPYDFDSYRVFTWNPRRHRYETAYIQRNVEGFLPVIVNSRSGEMRFEVCLANDDESKSARTFHLVDRQVKFLGTEPCKAPEAVPSTAVTPAPSTDPSLKDKVKEKAAEMKRKMLGK